MKERGIVNLGNLYRMQQLIRKAEEGHKLTLGFIGGSITQGSLASSEDSCYAALVVQWWKHHFPKAEFQYINAGIGGTTSQFAVARVKDDLLQYNPDFVIAEFSVNDANTQFFQETFEGLLRTILEDDSEPALMILNNVQYNNGENAQEVHNAVAMYYDLPIYSFKDSLYYETQTGNLKKEQITPDDLHPNDYGHSLLADGICYTLGKICAIIRTTDCMPYTMKREPYTQNRYQKSVRLQNDMTAHVHGFTADHTPQDAITQMFRNGWTAVKKDSTLYCEVSCSYIAVQYRKTIKKPAPTAKVIIDGKVADAMLLDANFAETWGDCLALDTVFQADQKQKHSIEIRIADSNDCITPFYLVSIIVA